MSETYMYQSEILYTYDCVRALVCVRVHVRVCRSGTRRGAQKQRARSAMWSRSPPLSLSFSLSLLPLYLSLSISLSLSLSLQ